jgi:type I restriction enzyme M protein
MVAVAEGSDALGFENELWASANKMRGNMDASEYKHVVLPLVFLKYISDAFEDIHADLIARGRNAERRDEYLAQGVFWVPEKGRWNAIVEKARDPSIGIIIDDAMEAIERDNPELRNVLPKNFGNSDLSSRILGEVVTLFGNLPSFGDKDARSKDIIGRVYEYFIGKFAEAEKKGGGEFYTPRSVVRLLTEILQPYEGRIYDGCCGSGGMFVQSLKFMEAHSGRINASVWGQESNPTTWRLAKMNLAIRRIDANLGEGHADTLLNDNYPDLRADYAIVNPPFNIKDWGYDSLKDDSRWTYGVPPSGNANYAWIQHYLHHLSPQGMAGIVMSNGSLSTSRKEEKTIREGIIDDDKLDCVIMLPDKLFTNTGISACIWILSNSKTDSKFRNRKGETLFIDCRGMGSMVNRTLRELTVEDVDKISGTYQNWRSKTTFDDYEDERGFCKATTTEGEIKEHEYIIVPGRYVGAPPLPDDGEPFEEKMKRLTSELGEHFTESRRLEEEIRKNLGDLGFDF